MNVAELSPSTRHESLVALQSRELDVLVIGGGVVGAGTALDAVTRGLDTGLVEASDWASGTSSRSSKLIHGGLRYLEMLDIHLVREALRERGLLLSTLAPHLVQPVAFLYPLRHRLWERPYAGAGIALYDFMALRSGGLARLPRHRHLSRSGTLQLAPGLRPGALVGAIEYFDAQVDDARFTMMLTRTAASYGALVANRARVTEVERSGERVTGVRIMDVESGDAFSVRAKVVISATGVWSEETQALAEVGDPLRVRASKGVHLVVHRSQIQLTTGLIMRTETSVLFVIPWSGYWIIGTTDTEYHADKTNPTATENDVDYLLGHLNSVLVAPLRREDIVGVYAGLRPLLDGGAVASAKLSREHTVSQPRPGLVVVAGGKFTTYRVMAEDTVDAAIEQLSRAVPASRTRDIQIVGGDDWTAIWESRHELAVEFGLDIAWIEHLLHRYGSLTSRLLTGFSDDRSLASPLASGHYLKGEISYAVTNEGALHLVDVLSRRTHLSLETGDHGLGAAREVGDVMAELLGWGPDQVLEELTAYEESVRW